MLMQLAQPLICEARIFTSSTSVGSRQPFTARERLIQALASSGAAANTSNLAVMVIVLHVTTNQ